VVCACRGGEVLYEERLGLAAHGSPRHSTTLLAEIERAAAASGGWEKVDQIAVGRGPGSFVGIRIGLSTAYGLAASTSLPLVGVCTLDALGRAVAVEPTSSAAPLPANGGQAHSESLVVLDARRGEVFAALYSPGGDRLWEPFVAAPAALVERLSALSRPPLAVGSGSLRFRDELASRDVEIPDDDDPIHRVAGRHLWALAEAAADAGGAALEPIYLRPPDAQRWRERDDSKRAN
jgi:tRNA threonylcarbamoyladenosine biosynthesis protein TsaB